MSFTVAAATTALTATSAVALPEGRVYELVSPVFKGGYGVDTLGSGGAFVVAGDGERAAYVSPGAFAGAPNGASLSLDYLAHRTETGWQTTPLMPPASVTPSLRAFDLSPSLATVMQAGLLGPNAENATQRSKSEVFFLHDTASPDIPDAWEVAGELESQTEEPEVTAYEGATKDFCHLFIERRSAAPGHDYELNRGCDGTPKSLIEVTQNDQGAQFGFPCGLGAQENVSANPSAFHAFSEDGSEVFFTECYGGESSSSHHQLYLRLGNARTLEVSKPMTELDLCAEESACANAAARPAANFAGASENGSAVFFTTAAPLVAQDSDIKPDLYVATVGCTNPAPTCAPQQRTITSLTQVSRSQSTGEVADVSGVLRVAPDGSRVYFLARGVLTDSPNLGGAAAVKGAENMYVYDVVTGHTDFIADLCTGQESSGVARDSGCPSERTDAELWEGSQTSRRVQTAGPDGRFIVFSSVGQLTAGDTDVTTDVYRYDAVTERLTRVSHGEAGFGADGNSGSFDAVISPGHVDQRATEPESGTRAISEDGSRVVFTTAAPLSPQATNALQNAYEWHAQPEGEGTVALISTGQGTDPVTDVVISPSGRDVFFVTSEGVDPQDTDGLGDLYDARLGGGFAAIPTLPQPCAGDACQGPLTNPAPQLLPGSVTQAPDLDPQGSPPAKANHPATHSRPRARKCKRGYVRTRRKCHRQTARKQVRRNRGGS